MPGTTAVITAPPAAGVDERPAPATPVPTAPARPRHTGAPADAQARKVAERNRKELLALIGVDNLATFEIVDNGKTRRLLEDEVTRIQTPVGPKGSIKPLTWLLALVRTAVTPTEAAPAKVYAPGWSPAEVEEARAAFVLAYKGRLNAQTRLVDGEQTPELGTRRLTLLTTPVKPGQSLGEVKWLLVRTEKWLRRQHGGPRVAYSSG